MTRLEINSIHLPCLLQHKPSGLVVRVEHINGDEGVGNVKYVGSNNDHVMGERSTSWNMVSFSMMDNNNLYEDQS